MEGFAKGMMDEFLVVMHMDIPIGNVSGPSNVHLNSTTLSFKIRAESPINASATMERP